MPDVVIMTVIVIICTLSTLAYSLINVWKKSHHLSYTYNIYIYIYIYILYYLYNIYII